MRAYFPALFVNRLVRQSHNALHNDYRFNKRNIFATRRDKRRWSAWKFLAHHPASPWKSRLLSCLVLHTDQQYACSILRLQWGRRPMKRAGCGQEWQKALRAYPDGPENDQTQTRRRLNGMLRWWNPHKVSRACDRPPIARETPAAPRARPRWSPSADRSPPRRSSSFHAARASSCSVRSRYRPLHARPGTLWMKVYDDRLWVRDVVSSWDVASSIDGPTKP